MEAQITTRVIENQVQERDKDLYSWYLRGEQSGEVDLRHHLASTLAVAVSITVLWLHLSTENISVATKYTIIL